MKIIISKKKKNNNIYINNSYKNINKLILLKNNLIILDYNIFILFFSIIKNEFKNYKFIIFPYGENFKNINSLKIIWKYMIKKSINKNFIITIIGGGVLGDLISFASNLYFRGLNFIFLPTSLLSQIDSSIGGKNAINFFSKNALGNINSSIFIFINYNIIFYMKKKEFLDGYSEIIKYSLINNKKMFFFIYKKNFIKKIIIRSCYIKSKIISQDYFENNYRTILNFGHTYGHCVENNKISNLSHGKSVVIGIIFSIYISSIYYNLNIKNIKKILYLFKKLNFFLKNIVNFSKKMIYKIILDKKFNNKINYVLIKKIGVATKKQLKKKILIFLLKKFYEI